jgi:hypothetical protein
VARQSALAAERRARTEAQRQCSPLLDSIAAGLSEMRQASQAGTVREGDVKAALLRQDHAEQMLRAAQAEAARVKVRKPCRSFPSPYFFFCLERMGAGGSQEGVDELAHFQALMSLETRTLSVEKVGNVQLQGT